MLVPEDEGLYRALKIVILRICAGRTAKKRDRSVRLRLFIFMMRCSCCVIKPEANPWVNSSVTIPPKFVELTPEKLVCVLALDSLFNQREVDNLGVMKKPLH